MSIIEFEIKNPRKKLEFYEQLHKENITRIEKLRKEKKHLKEVIEKANNGLITLIQIIMEQPSKNVEEDNYLLSRLESI